MDKSTDVAPAKLSKAGQINQVIQWAVSGSTEHEICEAIAATFPEEEPTMLLAAAMRRIADNANADPSLIRAWTFEAAREMYRRQVEANDFGGAVRTLKFMNEVAGRFADVYDDDKAKAKEAICEPP